MTDEGRTPAVILIAMVAIASVVGYLYLSGTFSSYSAGVTSCTTFNDALTLQSSQYCSTLQSIRLAPASVTALTPSGKNFTFYDSASGKSAPLVRDARLTLSVQNAAPLGFSVTSTCTALVDGKQAATNSSKDFYQTLNGARVCVISIDGKALQAQFATGTSTHLVQYSVAGKAIAVFATGATQSRTFSGSLGNVTITVSNASPATPTKEMVSSNTIPLPQIQAPSGVQVGSSQNAVSTSTMVAPVTAPLISPTTNTVNPDYVEKTTQTILTSSANVPVQVQVGTSSISVNACDIGSCSYSPPSTGQTTATVTATVSREDITAYQRDSQQILNQFGARDVSELTSYSRCSYFHQC